MNLMKVLPKHYINILKEHGKTIEDKEINYEEVDQFVLEIIHNKYELQPKEQEEITDIIYDYQEEDK